MDVPCAVVGGPAAVDQQIILEPFIRLHKDADPPGIPVRVVTPLVPDIIPGVAAPVLIGAGDADHQLIASQRNVDRTFQTAQVIIADAAFDIAFELVRRPACLEQDGAARRVATEQRTLRS